MAAPSKQTAALTSPGYLVPFITVTALFFIFGFITNLNMALVPHLRSIFDLPYAWAMLAESAFFLAYLVFASPTSRLIEAIGYKRTMVVSLFIQVVGCLMFVPAAKLVSFPLFLTAVFVVGAGVTALQTSANPYVSILGPEHSAPVRLTLAQAFNSIGGTIAPLIAGAYILTDSTKLTKAAIADTVRLPYILIAAGLLLLGLAVAFSHLPAVTRTESFRPGKEGDGVLGTSIWSYKHTVLGALGIFFYVGVEVGLASIGVNYFLTQGVNSAKVASFFESLGGFGALVTRWLGPWTNVEIAAILVSLYWFGALVGRLLDSDQSKVRKAAGHLRLCRRRHGAPLHGYHRTGRHLEPGAVRILQLHHVPQHLHAGYRRPGTDDQQGLGAHHDRGGRRGGDSPAAGRASRQGGHSERLRPSHRLLPLHRLLRPVGI